MKDYPIYKVVKNSIIVLETGSKSRAILKAQEYGVKEIIEERIINI